MDGEIAAAQRARWAQFRKETCGQSKVVPIYKKRTLSQLRKKIAAAERARWAKAAKETA